MPQVIIALPYGPESADAVEQLTSVAEQLGAEVEVIADPGAAAAAVEETVAPPPLPEEEAGTVMQEQGARGLRPPMEGDQPAQPPKRKPKGRAGAEDREGRRPPPKR